MPSPDQISEEHRHERVIEPIARILPSIQRQLLRRELLRDQGIAGVERWRKLDGHGAYAKDMRQFFDACTVLDEAGRAFPERRAEARTLLFPQLSSVSEAAPKKTRLQEFQELFLAAKEQQPDPLVRPEVRSVFEHLRTMRSEAKTVSAIDIFLSSEVPCGVKDQWFRAHLLSILRFFETRDQMKEEEQEEEKPEDEEEESEEEEQEEQGGQGGQEQGPSEEAGDEGEEESEKEEAPPSPPQSSNEGGGEEQSHNAEEEPGETDEEGGIKQEEQGKSEEGEPSEEGDQGQEALKGEEEQEEQGGQKDKSEAQAWKDVLPDISKDELQEMIEDAKEEVQSGEAKPKESEADRREKERQMEKNKQFSLEAGCSLEEAQTIRAQIERTRALRDTHGRNIRDQILKEFQNIVQRNLVERSRYVAPVPLSEAEEIDDIVGAGIALRTGNFNPLAGGKEEPRVELEQVYGGFDVFLVVDKSGSMGLPIPDTQDPDNPTENVKPWKKQQTFIFLVMDALQEAEQSFKKQGIKLLSPLQVRMGLVSFQEDRAHDELPLGTHWSAKEQYTVWKALQSNVGGGTPDHLGLAKVRQMIDEDALQETRGKKHLQLVLLSTDGGSDDEEAVQEVKQDLEKRGAIVKAAGIGEGAEAVETTYGADGKHMDDFDDIPVWAAEQVIAEAKKLYPRQVQRK